eukprot:g11535.t1 g11535   contig6:23031-23564(-)
MASQLPPSPRSRRKTAKAAAVKIAAAVGNSAADTDDDSYVPEPDHPPPSARAAKPRSGGHAAPKRISYSRSNSSSSKASTASNNNGKKLALSNAATEYLKNWMLSPQHIEHPYPSEDEKAFIMQETGIEMKQLTNWFVNNRKRIWKPRMMALKEKGGHSRVDASGGCGTGGWDGGWE